jgi:hypothetical protein
MLSRYLAAFCLILPLAAQTYTLAPTGKVQYFDNNGIVLSGGLLCSYAAGTSTPQATYADSGGTPNSNPVVLDSAGRATVYLSSANSYKLVLEKPAASCAAGVILWTQDNIAANAAGSFLPLAGGTMSGTLNFSAGDITGVGNVSFVTSLKTGGNVVIDSSRNGTFSNLLPLSAGTGQVGSSGTPWANVTANNFNSGTFTASKDSTGGWANLKIVTSGGAGGQGSIFPASALTDLGLQGNPFRNAYFNTLQVNTTFNSNGNISSIGTINPATNGTSTVGDSGHGWGAFFGAQANIGGAAFGLAGAGLINIYSGSIPFALLGDNTGGGANLIIGNALGVGVLVPYNGTTDIGKTASRFRNIFGGTVDASVGITANGLAGLTQTLVVKGSAGASCNVILTYGLITSTNCP